MRSIRLIVCALVAGAALGGCASSKPPPAPSGQVPVYMNTQLMPSQYTVINRLWVDSWRSNFTYPSFDSADAGVQALESAAADVGANGLLNVMCVDVKNGRLLCYGDAVNISQAPAQ